MSHEVETMAYANEVPWHGLGTKVDANASIEEMLKASGLDWEVKKYPCYVAIDGKQVRIPRHALVRETDKKVMTITGDTWKPFQNRDALEFFRDYTKAGGASLETAGSLHGGKVIWGLAKLNRTYDVVKGDRVGGYLLLTSPHQVGSSISIYLTMMRVVCRNTMAIAISQGNHRYSQNHMREFDVAAAQEAVGLAIEQIGDEERYAKTLLKLKLSLKDSLSVLSDAVNPTPEGMAKKEWIQKMVDDAAVRGPTINQIIHSMNTAPGHVEGTGWGLLNGVTHWADHVAGRTRDSRLNSAWFGKNARLKLNVRSKLLAMAD